jgi:RNA recognition motif-containing protein
VRREQHQLTCGKTACHSLPWQISLQPLRWQADKIRSQQQNKEPRPRAGFFFFRSRRQPSGSNEDTHMKKLFVGNLPQDATEDSVRAMFSAFGTVRSINVASDIFTGRCKGFGFIEMEGHEARAAQAALDGNMVGDSDRSLRVRFDDPKASSRGGRKRR